MKQRKFSTVCMGITLSILSFGVVARAAEVPSGKIDPSNFTTNITNKYFPLTPGVVYNFETKTSDGTETNKTIVTNLRRDVMGVKTLVVWDRVWLDGNLVEETYDWYAQNKTTGDVWYFGEESREYEGGKVSSTHGSWEGGINAARPGIIMKANPKVGDSYYQEYLKGEAEDQVEVLALNEKVSVPYGTFENCLKTKDYTLLDPQNVENKYYCPTAGGLTLTIKVSSGEKDGLMSKTINSDFVGLSANGNTDDDLVASDDSYALIMIIVAIALLGILAGIGLDRFVINQPKQS